MSRLWLIVIVCTTVVVCACSNKDDAPSGIIPKEKMEAVLWDMIQAERFTSTFMAKDSAKNIKLENFKLYSQIFDLHQIDKEDFIKSYQFYLSRPDISRVMFDSLTTRSNREREEMFRPKPVDSTKIADSTKTADSIKTLKPTPPQPAQRIKIVKDSLVAIRKRQRDSTALKPLISDSVKRKLLKPTNRTLLRPRMRVRDSLLRQRTP
jgi:hypothetical protein